MNKQEVLEMMVDTINDLHYKTGEIHKIEKEKIDEIVNQQKDANYIVCDALLQKLKEKSVISIDL